MKSRERKRHYAYNDNCYWKNLNMATWTSGIKSVTCKNCKRMIKLNLWRSQHGLD